MTFSFRVRINLAPNRYLDAEESELELQVPGAPQPIVIRSCQPNIPIRESPRLCLLGTGYLSAEEARIAGLRCEKALMTATAHVGLGADFGHRSLKGAITEQGLLWLASQIGQRVVNDEHGLMVFETEPSPRFAGSEATITAHTSTARFKSAFTRSTISNPPLSQKELLAFILFHASFFQTTPDTRFLLLVMAVEALMDPALRSPDAVALVDSFLTATKSSQLPAEEKNSLFGSLRWLRRESINQAGRRLAKERLGTKTYSEQPAADFFSFCYQLRSNLVHGSSSAPPVEQVNNTVGPLETFVSDLLTGPLFDDDSSS